MKARRWILLACLALSPIACDGQDPERLNRVGKKLVEKGRKVTDEAQLPKVTISAPEAAKTTATKAEKSEPSEQE